MLRSLSSHPEVLISNETHYFDDLRTKMAGREHSELADDERLRCEDYFLALAHRGYGRRGDPEQSRMDRAELGALARSIGPGADSYFEAFCRLQAQVADKSRWGEKTPRHVYRLKEILEQYPEARVVCMVRDPRAVVASYRDWTNEAPIRRGDGANDEVMALLRTRKQQSYDLTMISMMWRSSIKTALQGQRDHGTARVRLQRYEDLIVEPEVTLRDLAWWLDLDFASGMLDVKTRNSSYTQSNRDRGMSTEPLKRWRSKLSDREIAVIQATCGRLMASQGYDREPLTVSPLVLLASWLAVPRAALRALFANRNRTGNIAAYLWRRLRLAFG